MRRKVLALFMAIIIVAVSSVYIIEYESSTNTPPSEGAPSTVVLVKQNAGMVAAAAMSQANVLNISFNYSNTVDKIMGSYYELENNSAFQGLFKNHSSSIVVSCTYSINASQFSPSNPTGLDSDYVYIEFLDVYTYQHNNTGQPTQFGSILYSINAGTGIVAGPDLLTQYEMYALSHS